MSNNNNNTDTITTTELTVTEQIAILSKKVKDLRTLLPTKEVRIETLNRRKLNSQTKV